MATENTQMIIDNVDALQVRMKEMRKAQQVFATYTQEQVDKIFFAAAMAANKARIPLAKMAVQETGMGVVEDKVIKTTMLPNISTTLTVTPKPVGSSRRTRHTVSKRLQSRSV